MGASASAAVEQLAGCRVRGARHPAAARNCHSNGSQTPEELAARVARSCAAQGVPVKVTDALVVDQVAALLGRRDASPPARSADGIASRRSSEPPDDFHAVGV
jgi:hypothetical protein